MTRKLILIKHSLPHIDATLPSNQWQLSAIGERRCETLGRALQSHGPFRLFSSKEAKALRTAELVARQLGIDAIATDDMHETDRSGVPVMAKKAFTAAVRDYFQHPGEVVMGAESAESARKRFTAAVCALETRVPGDVAVITHGTVMSLFIAQALGGEHAFDIWRRLGLPSYCVLEGPARRLVHIEERVGM